MTDDDALRDDEARQENRDIDLVKSHVAQLAEHFETVHVFCTRHMPAELDGTVCVQWGAGNWFARYGSVREWVVKREEWMRQDARNEE